MCTNWCTSDQDSLVCFDVSLDAGEVIPNSLVDSYMQQSIKDYVLEKRQSAVQEIKCRAVELPTTPINNY